MTTLNIKEIHVRQCRIQIGKVSLEKLLRDFAINEAGFQPDATVCEVRFEDETAGSPPYKVGTRCVVNLTEDQKQMPGLLAEGQQ